jgi:hypothetical protein
MHGSRKTLHALVCTVAALMTFVAAWASLCEMRMACAVDAPVGFRPLFDGTTLAGWHSALRIGVPAKPAPVSESGKRPAQGPISKALQVSQPRWEVRDGMILGAQADSRLKKPETGEDWGLGSWLMTDQTFGDFELLVSARPDWPCDTGIYVRSTPLGQGFQILLDHRGDDTAGVGGSVGFLYLRGIGGFSVNPYNFRWAIGADGKPREVLLQPAAAPVARPEIAATSDDFRRAWRLNDWNTFRIRVVGELPRITTWINDVKICDCDTALIKHADYDPAAVRKLIGPRGHIAFEVHDGPPWRWGVDSITRWKNVFIKEL